MKKLFIIISLILIIAWFYKINENNYKTIRKIKLNTINHPEWLPKKNIAKITSFWFSNVKADYYWLETIQYIWANAIKSEYKKYLYKMLDLITELNPYFYHPYKIWLLLLPNYNKRYENLTEKKQEEYKNQAIKIWLKWIKNTCNTKKLELIKKEDNLKKLWTEEKYKNPCKDYLIPYYLAFDYYFYKNNPKKSAYYYKVASANTDSLEWAKILAAIMKSKAWERQKAFFMFINMAIANWKENKNKACYNFANKLNNIWYSIFSWKIAFDWKILKELDSLRKLLKTNKKEKDDTCPNYVNKSIRVLNLAYLDLANKAYYKKFQKYAQTPQELKKANFINYIPKDYQVEDKQYIEYYFNKKLWVFDTRWHYSG